MSPVNISIFVDVIALLAGEGTEKSIFLFDDSPVGSVGKGGPGLQTPVYPGQLVRWTLKSIDVQTPVWLSGLSFEDYPAADTPVCSTVSPVWARNWEGYVPGWSVPSALYPYRLSLQFGGLTGRTEVIEGPALVYQPA